MISDNLVARRTYDMEWNVQDINFEEKVCLELNEMGVLEINPEELRTWMIDVCGDEDDVRSKPGVEDDMYENGTWMLSGWVVNKKSNSSSSEVGRGNNNVRAVCTNKMGCACRDNNFEMGLPKLMLDLLQGNY